MSRNPACFSAHWQPHEAYMVDRHGQGETMRAVVITEPGGPGVLAIRDVPRPIPGPGEVLVRVRGSALNRADLLQRRGQYPAPPGSPAEIPGIEITGEVVSRGASAGRWSEGARVFGIVGGGAH